MIPEPNQPWPEDWTPLATEDAVQVIMCGNHAHARQNGQKGEEDRAAVKQLRSGSACAALDFLGMLVFQATAAHVAGCPDPEHVMWAIDGMEIRIGTPAEISGGVEADGAITMPHPGLQAIGEAPGLAMVPQGAPPPPGMHDPLLVYQGDISREAVRAVVAFARVKGMEHALGTLRAEHQAALDALTDEDVEAYCKAVEGIRAAIAKGGDHGPANPDEGTGVNPGA